MIAGRASLRGRLLRWILVPVGAVWAVDAWFTYDTVRASIDAAYDRALGASALAISEHVTMGAGEPVVDLPPIALELLDTGDQERVFYRVSYRTPAGADAVIAGYGDLPRPGRRPAGTLFYDASYRGDAVRVAALAIDLASDPPTDVLVQVAETVGARDAMRRRILAQALGVEAALIVLTGVLVALGVARGLRPLLALGEEVGRRSAADLTPLGMDVPREVRRLVEATNRFMGRVRDAIGAQRRFVADASHQLRTPLAVLRAEADAALRLEDPAALRGAVERLRDHSGATSHLASQLLALARAEPGAELAASEVDLAALVREACAALVPHAVAQGVDLGFEGDGVARVRADPMLVRELVANLVDNAIRYGGRPGRVTVGVAPDAGGALLAVEDEGPGIPSAERDRVLERFYRIAGAGGDGCGLGLAIVREIAERHGATLRLTDGAGGRGLRVEVSFPASPRRAS